MSVRAVLQMAIALYRAEVRGSPSRELVRGAPRRFTERRENCRDDRHQQQWKQGNRWLKLSGNGVGDTRIEKRTIRG